MEEPNGVRKSTLAQQSDELVTGEAVALDVRPASFLLRAAGAIIDFIATLIVAFALMGVLLSVAQSGSLDVAALTAFSTAIVVFSFVIVPTVVETITHGRSLGKLTIGARIVRDDGGAIGFRHAFIRALTGFLEIYMTFGGLAAIVGLLSDRSKRIGDLLAGTYSQHERVPRIVEPVVGVPPQLASWATLADVGRMPDRLSRRIAQFLKQAPRLTEHARSRLARDLAAEASVFVSPVPDVDPQIFLYAVAAVRRDREFHALMLERERLARLQPVLTGLPHGFPDR
ncbi:RDD family protein [Okibacterium endophyticum]